MVALIDTVTDCAPPSPPCRPHASQSARARAAPAAVAGAGSRLVRRDLDQGGRPAPDTPICFTPLEAAYATSLRAGGGRRIPPAAGGAAQHRRIGTRREKAEQGRRGGGALAPQARFRGATQGADSLAGPCGPH